MSTTWEGNLKCPLAVRESEVYFGVSVLKHKNTPINPERKHPSSCPKAREVPWPHHARPWRLGDTLRTPSARGSAAESRQFSFDLEHLEETICCRTRELHRSFHLLRTSWEVVRGLSRPGGRLSRDRRVDSHPNLFFLHGWSVRQYTNTCTHTLGSSSFFKFLHRHSLSSSSLLQLQLESFKPSP